MLGRDPRRDHDELGELVGAQLQDSQLPDKIKVGEALDLYASFYRRPARADELLTRLGLAGQRNAFFSKLSGGQKQRLSVALALIGSPKVAVLDELTTGLDPNARREVWDLISEIRSTGVTILLLTHFMEEAERLCDRVAVINHGRVVANDTPGGLAIRAGGEQHIRFQPSGATRAISPRCRKSNPSTGTASSSSSPGAARHCRRSSPSWPARASSPSTCGSNRPPSTTPSSPSPASQRPPAAARPRCQAATPRSPRPNQKGTDSMVSTAATPRPARPLRKLTVTETKLLGHTPAVLFWPPASGGRPHRAWPDPGGRPAAPASAGSASCRPTCLSSSSSPWS